MENTRLKALLKLLTSETDTHNAVLRKEIAAALEQDPVAVKTAMAEEFSADTPLHVVHALEEIYWEELARSLACFSAKINPDLEEGLQLLAQFTEPGSSSEQISQSIDGVARALRPALLNAAGYTEIALILGHYFFDTLGFKPLPNLVNAKEISFARFLRTRKGSGLCAACLYAVVGARYGLDISIVDVAGRILVHLQDFQQDQSLFIDPLDNGKLLTQADCRAYLESRQLAWSDEFTAPLSSRQIVRRFIANMIFVLNKVNDTRRLSYLRNYLEILQN